MIRQPAINDPHLAAALNEVQATMRRHGVAGSCVLISATEAAYTHGLDAPWAAIQFNTKSQPHFRICAKPADPELKGATHVSSKLADFAQRATVLAGGLKLLLYRAGVRPD